MYFHVSDALGAGSLKVNYSRWRKSATGRTVTNGLTWATKRTQTDSVKLTPQGEHEFRIKDVAVPIGNTNVNVTVSDMSFGAQSKLVVSDGNMYWLPSYVRRGAAHIAGTERPDNMNISQDDTGNTILDVKEGGNAGRANLGRISMLSVEGFAGDDKISIKGSRYFSGVTVDAGSDNDIVKLDADLALAQGVAVSGGAGADSLSVTGSQLKSMLNGDEGNDFLNADQLLADHSFFPALYGGDGTDYIVGSADRDHIYGEAGADYLKGADGNDVLWGGAGDDMISGGAGDDWLRGQAGIDGLMGDMGRDNITGGTGDDFLYAGEGRDVMQGGEGADNIGPLTWNPQQIHAYQRVGNHLKVDVRGEYRSQPVINNLKEYYRYGKIFQQYDSSEDYLVDRNEIV